MNLKKLITLSLEQPKCIGCKLCEIVCPHRVLKVTNKKASIIYKERCIECGACMSNCPVGAVTVKAGVGCAQAIFNGGTCC